MGGRVIPINTIDFRPMTRFLLSPTGVYNMSMSLIFYSGPPPPRCADVIIPIGPSDGQYAPFGISDVNPFGDTVLSGLPRNILRAEVEVLASATAADEFYWANTPSE